MNGLAAQEPSRWRPWAIGAALLATFATCVALPLMTYTTTLALFGLAHVVSEMRWVDHQYGERLRGGLAAWLAGPLLVAVAARLATMAGWLQPEWGVTLELAAGAALLAVVVAFVRRRRWAVAALAAVLLAGAIAAPFHALLLLAVLHNFTPIAFLAQALEGERRRRALIAACGLFVGAPLLIATGLPLEAMRALGLSAPEASLFAAGSLGGNLGAYLPREFTDADWALNAFSAAVFAQCLHYAAVILVLPRLIPDGRVSGASLVRWPPAPVFAAGLAVVSTGVALAYAADYAMARRVYALAALLHAWIEIPILALVAAGTINFKPSLKKSRFDEIPA